MAVTNKHGALYTVCEGATASTSKEIDCSYHNALLVWHEIAGAPTTGGYVSIELLKKQGDASGLPHPAPAANSDWGLNVKTAATTAGYACIFRGVSRRVLVKVNITDGQHTVNVMPITV